MRQTCTDTSTDESNLNRCSRVVLRAETQEKSSNHGLYFLLFSSFHCLERHQRHFISSPLSQSYKLQFKSNLTNHAKHFQTLSGFNLRITWVWQTSVCAVQRFPEMSTNIVCQTLSKPPTHLLLFACVRLQLSLC